MWFTHDTKRKGKKRKILLVTVQILPSGDLLATSVNNTQTHFCRNRHFLCAGVRIAGYVHRLHSTQIGQGKHNCWDIYYSLYCLLYTLSLETKNERSFPAQWSTKWEINKTRHKITTNVLKLAQCNFSAFLTYRHYLKPALLHMIQAPVRSDIATTALNTLYMFLLSFSQLPLFWPPFLFPVTTISLLFSIYLLLVRVVLLCLWHGQSKSISYLIYWQNKILL